VLLPRALDGVVRSTSRTVFGRALDRLLKRP